MVEGMDASFKSFAIGFGLSFILLFLILIAQFRSFIDPFLIMLAIPMGFVGVLIILPLTHTTLNVMSLMGVLMLIGIADSNSILIVDFAHKLEEQGLSVADAVITACRVRLRPILMTSLATIIGMIPMAMKLGEGGEQYTPMARAIIGGLTSSVLLTVFIVPAAYLLVYGRKEEMFLRIRKSGSRAFVAISRAVASGLRADTARSSRCKKPRRWRSRIIRRFRPRRMKSTTPINKSSINRSAYYPAVSGDITGSQGNNLARIGAGDLPASRLFNRVGQGVVVRQLITDSGRTPNLVASCAFASAGHRAELASHSLRRVARGESRLFRRAARASRW